MVCSIPKEILDAIGIAKSVGRDRWYELKQLLDRPEATMIALELVQNKTFYELNSNQRFEQLLSHLKRKQRRSIPKKNIDTWIAENGNISAEMKKQGRNYNIQIKAKGESATGFGQYLADNIGLIYEEYCNKTG